MKKQKGLAMVSIALGVIVIGLLILYGVVEKNSIFMELGLLGLGLINIVNGIAKWQENKQRIGVTIIAFGVILGTIAIFTMVTKYMV